MSMRARAPSPAVLQDGLRLPKCGWNLGHLKNDDDTFHIVELSKLRLRSRKASATITDTAQVDKPPGIRQGSVRRLDSIDKVSNNVSLRAARIRQRDACQFFPLTSRQQTGGLPMKLTAQALAKHKWPAKSDCIIFDDDIAGFGLRKREGRQSWVFQYAFGSGVGRITRRIKLGDYPALSPARARAEAEDLHAKVHLHGDPAVERRKNRIEASNTFGKLVEQYLEFKRPQMRPRSFEEVKRHLMVNAKPLHGLPLASVDQVAIANRLSAFAKHGAVATNRTRASLSAMFVWAMGEGLALVNPVAHTNRREEKARDRVLSDAELRTVWHSVEDDDFGYIVKLLMLTGQRKSEIAGLRWDEINGEQIVLPSERTKNGRAHVVPLSETVRAILEAFDNKGRAYVFGRDDNGGFKGWTVPRRRLAARCALPHWTLHDLRRSVATGMADIGIQPHIIEAVLNHVSGHKGGVAGVYNRSSYAKEKAEALARWDEHVRGVVGMRGR
jgi:integrase